MCFSATASFAASGALAVIGAASVQQSPKKARLFAAIPFLFAIQQAIEGFQWLSLDRGNPSLALAYGFLFFAFLLWPVYIPLAYTQMEKRPKQRKILQALLALGVAQSAYLLICLAIYPVGISIHELSIKYYLNIHFFYLLPIIYTLIISIGGMISKSPYVRMLGVLLLISSALSGLIYNEAFVSTWCFFAALLSSLVFAEIRRLNRHP